MFSQQKALLQPSIDVLSRCASMIRMQLLSLMVFFFVGLGNWACSTGCQITDGSPGDLRTYLPKAVGVLHNLIDVDEKKVYLHCTAGVGRSPSVAVAYYYWFKGKNVSFDLAPCMLLANVTLPLISLPWCYNYWLCHWLHVLCLWDPWSRFKV
jgi:hypothetical protein